MEELPQSPKTKNPTQFLYNGRESEDVGVTQSPSKPSQTDQLDNMMNILKENVDKLPTKQQSDVKKLLEDLNAQKKVIVQLDNAPPFQTRMTQDEILEASQKEENKQLTEEELLASQPHVYKKHPKKTIHYPPHYQQPKGQKYGKGIVGDAQNTPSIVDTNEENRPTFVDPKLLNMDSVVQDLKQAPNKLLDATSKLMQALKPAGGSDDQIVEKQQEDEVGCSKESEEIYPLIIHAPYSSNKGHGHYGGDYDRSAEGSTDKKAEQQSQQKSKEVVQSRGKMDWSPESRPQSDQLSHHVGKFVPDQETHVVQNNYDTKNGPNKMYYVGDNVKLPVLMKQHHDGTYHIAVDVHKLCNCKDGNCTGVPEHGTVNMHMNPVVVPTSNTIEEKRIQKRSTENDNDDTYKKPVQSFKNLFNEISNISNEDDDVKYKINKDDDKYYVTNRIDLIKKLLSWIKTLVVDGIQNN